MKQTILKPGNLVHTRGREWVIQPPVADDLLYLRPLGGTELDIQVLIPSLEPNGVSSAVFPLPDAQIPGSSESARLLRDALTLKLQSGAGPFRSFGKIAVEPRAYQLVPLLMALKLPVVRLLIADDVGIGKTIEAGLIARELLDRGEIERFAVLCPPHLVEQWQFELREHFHINSVGLTAKNVAKLERQVPQGMSLFEHHRFVVVSLDYIKSDSHKDHFLSHAPNMIIVDEAHTCTIQGQGRQKRYELLKKLSEDSERHIVMLTATPHSGKDEGYYNLLSLLNPEFYKLSEGVTAEHPLRQKLAMHMVQRRRKDIDEWQEERVFPRRFTKEFPYSISGKWGQFFDKVKDYCTGLAEKAESQKGDGARMIWYSTLALLRCVSSSPAAAEKTLTSRLLNNTDSIYEKGEDDRLMDGDEDELSITDLEPTTALEDSSEIEELIRMARTLRGKKGDSKYASLLKLLKDILPQFRPVIFCRYIATAQYLAEELRKDLKADYQIDAITGEYNPDEREERVESLISSHHPILVATDCLSEGINLQHGFNAVIHYDLAWNPTRHEQREGRVDRFGQKSPEVRCSMLYGENNPIDGFILQVILRKAENIKNELGVLVPMPENRERIQQAMIKATLLRQREKSNIQPELNFMDDEFSKAINRDWEDAMTKARANRTIFAQRRLKPDDVLPEWKKMSQVLGDSSKVEEFVTKTCQRLNAPLEKENGAWRLNQHALPLAIRERLENQGFIYSKNNMLDFSYPPVTGAQFIHRSSSLVEILAEYLLEQALTEKNPLAARCGVTVSDKVDFVTKFYLIRIRHQMQFNYRKQQHQQMAEEMILLGHNMYKPDEWMPESVVDELLKGIKPLANLQISTISQEINKAIDYFTEKKVLFEQIARDRAVQLQEDHQRVRLASAQKSGTCQVEACLPLDLIGVYVILPADV